MFVLFTAFGHCLAEKVLSKAQNKKRIPRKDSPHPKSAKIEHFLSQNRGFDPKTIFL